MITARLEYPDVNMDSTDQIIEVFKTNVQDNDLAIAIKEKLLAYLPNGRINFDLDDCDKILRIMDSQINHALVIEILATNGFQCEVLMDE